MAPVEPILIVKVIAAIVGGLVVLVWSAGRLVEGSAATAWHLRVPALIVGMVIIGFGTSAPEFTVSLLSGLQGKPELALGNAFGSNIANIGLILGVTAIVCPVFVHSQVLRLQLPLLCVATLLSVALLLDGELTRLDGAVLLIAFIALGVWSVLRGRQHEDDALGVETTQELDAHPMRLPVALGWVGAGLVLLVVSSRVLVWGAVEAATLLGVSDLLIGLTVVAIGTSLPELASSIAATRKGESDLALGNVLGSNLLNTMAVVGAAVLAGGGMQIAPEVITRDCVVMGVLTVSLFALAFGFRGRRGRISRAEGAGLLLAYIAYTVLLVVSAVGSRAG